MLCVFSCVEKTNSEREYSKAEMQAILENSNKVKINREEEDIKNYIKRRAWKSIETGTGVHIVKYDSTKDSTPLIKPGNIVTVSCTVSLLNGKLCYSTADTEHKQIEFEVTKADLESGLHEALTYLKQGDKAIILIPSHRAHGLLGDQEKIPPLSTVVYDIQIYKVQQ